jgi:hypothetical protein
MIISGTRGDDRGVRGRHLMIVADHAKHVFAFGTSQRAAALLR